jgi:hypothetical protein
MEELFVFIIARPTLRIYRMKAPITAQSSTGTSRKTRPADHSTGDPDELVTCCTTRRAHQSRHEEHSGEAR